MQRINSLQDLHSQIQIQPPMHFDSSSAAGGGSGASNDEFLQQMLSAAPSWPPNDDSTDLASTLRHRQFLSSRPADYYDAYSFQSPNQVGDGSIQALFNGFTNQAPNHHQQQHFQSYAPPESAATNQQQLPSGHAGAPAQPRQRVRARRGQATDPHSIAERLRREKIAERMKALQEIVPNANKTDKASMLDEIIDYVKFLQLQLKVLSVSRLGGAVADISSAARGGDTCVAAAEEESQVAKLMEKDLGSAMQYLQGKGLCLMPISLATAISTTRNHHPFPSSPTVSALSSDANFKDSASVTLP